MAVGTKPRAEIVLYNVRRGLDFARDAAGVSNISKAPDSPALLAALRALANDCGIKLAPLLSVADLRSMYSIASTLDLEAIKNTARRMTLKYGGNPEPEPIPGFDPFAPKQAEPAPSAPANWLAFKEEIAVALKRTDERHISLADDVAGLARLHTALCDTVDSMNQLTGQALADEVESAVQKALKAASPTVLHIQRPADPAPVAVGLAHYRTPQIIEALNSGVNVYLHGPAGSGKTTAARIAAKALGVAFYFAAKVESEYLLLGFKDARGETVRTQFREAYEHGGLFLFDEMDASSPSAIVALNAALANGVCPFPDGNIERHADFYCIGAGNTVLSGANRQYVGRVQLDAASVDRFAFIDFGYDEKLERALSDNEAWCLHVQSVRKAIAERGINHLVTPRATFDGCKLLAAGFLWDEVESMSIFKGLDAATVAQIKSAAGGIL